MITLSINDLFKTPAKREELPFYLTKKDSAGIMHVYVYEHDSLTNGYVRKNATCTPKPYKGKFGVGYTINCHNAKSTRSAFKVYYIEVSHEIICSVHDNCTRCPLYSANGTEEQCYY